MHQDILGIDVESLRRDQANARIGVRITQEMHTEVCTWCEENNVTISALLSELIKKFLSQAKMKGIPKTY